MFLFALLFSYTEYLVMQVLFSIQKNCFFFPLLSVSTVSVFVPSLHHCLNIPLLPPASYSASKAVAQPGRQFGCREGCPPAGKHLLCTACSLCLYHHGRLQLHCKSTFTALWRWNKRGGGKYCRIRAYLGLCYECEGHIDVEQCHRKTNQTLTLFLGSFARSWMLSSMIAVWE